MKLNELPNEVQSWNQPAAPLDRHAIVFVVLLLGAQIVFGLISIVMTGAGLLSNRNFSGLSVVATFMPQFIPWGMAAGAQVLVVADTFYASEIVRNKRWWLFTIVIVSFAWIICFEVFHSLIQQTEGAVGPKMLAEISKRVEALDKAISETSNLIAADYNRRVSAYDVLIKDSQHGFDESGIAACGPICKRNFRKRERAVSGYAHLGVAIPLSAAAHDINNLYRSILSRHAQLKGHVNDYAGFLQELEDLALTAVVEKKAQAIATEIDAIKIVFEDAHQIDTRELAIQNAIAIVRGLFDGSVKPSHILPLVYAITPVFGGFACALLVAYLLSTRRRITGLREQAEAANEELDLLGKLSGRLLGTRIARRFLERIRSRKSD